MQSVTAAPEKGRSDPAPLAG